jgi:dolichyl-diphosphooligosaccharide--protein glycosyltransferase
VLCVPLPALQLVSEGFYEFWNWFDSDSWYPLGRVVGGTVYPGIMLTAGAVYTVLTKLTAWVQLRDVCVLTGPFFAGNTVRGGCRGMAWVVGGGASL